MARKHNTKNKIISQRDLNTLTSIKLEESISLINRILNNENIHNFTWETKCRIQDFIDSYQKYEMEKNKRDQAQREKEKNKFKFLRELRDFEN